MPYHALQQRRIYVEANRTRAHLFDWWSCDFLLGYKTQAQLHNYNTRVILITCSKTKKIAANSKEKKGWTEEIPIQNTLETTVP